MDDFTGVVPTRRCLTTERFEIVRTEDDKIVEPLHSNAICLTTWEGLREYGEADVSNRLVAWLSGGVSFLFSYWLLHCYG